MKEAMELAQDLRTLADRFSEGWHDGIKIDASDIMLLTDAAAALEDQPAQRKPLTDDEIWKFWCSRPEVLEGEDDSMEAEFVTAVRAVLAAHNIKENT